jgi:hypothetical protein
MRRINARVLRALLSYDPETGELRWKRRSRRWFARRRIWLTWNKRHAGRRAFTAINGMGRHQGTILGRHFLAYRVAFCLQTGRWPSPQIDHRNRNPLDDRWVNLRECTQKENCANRGPGRPPSG